MESRPKDNHCCRFAIGRAYSYVELMLLTPFRGGSLPSIRLLRLDARVTACKTLGTISLVLPVKTSSSM